MSIQSLILYFKQIFSEKFSMYNNHKELYELFNLQKIHCCGIGGIGVSGIANILHSIGYTVQGSDLNENDNVQHLKNLGIKTFQGHDGSNVQNSDLLLVSSAIPEDNPEVKYALQNNIPIVTRGKMLSQIARFCNTIAIAGSHGKTTTTAMIGYLLHADIDPTVIVGGVMNNFNKNNLLGASKFLVTETDESDGSFVDIMPDISIVTNIRNEHLNFYGSFEKLQEYFYKFISQTSFYGFSILCIDCKNVCKLIPSLSGVRYMTYSIEDSSANIYGHNIRQTENGYIYDVQISINEEIVILKDIILNMYGLHNVLNSLAGILVAYKMKINNIGSLLSRFQGVKRRMTIVGDKNVSRILEGQEYRYNVKIIDDYAHHPYEIENTINAINILSQSYKKIVLLWEPHRYSRVIDLFDEYQNVFDNILKNNSSYYLKILPMYKASEKTISGYENDDLVKKFQTYNPENAQHITFINDINLLEQEITCNTCFIFLGAGLASSYAYRFAKDLS